MDTILAPLFYLVSWIMIGWHWVFDQLIGIEHDGVSWTLSIIGLVVVIRTLLIPLFVRQIRSQRKVQLLQPQLRQLQERYKGDRQRLQQEMMTLYRDTGTNPLSSCLPLLLQLPVFFALFRVLDGISRNHARGAFKGHDVLFESARRAEIFGVQLADSFRGSSDTTTRVVAAVMVIIMVVTQFWTQRQLMRKNMPKEALEGQFAQMQKLMLYVLPLGFVFSGVFFPLGTVLYWLTSNMWTMGQQLFVIRRMPAPGTEAEKAHRQRLEAKARKQGVELPTSEVSQTTAHTAEQTPGDAVRQQPKRTSRSQRKRK